MIKWEELLDNSGTEVIKLFAQKKISGRKASQIFKNTKYAGPFRELIRIEGGVEKATTLARKALKRRNII
jgi:hypothetical protein